MNSPCISLAALLLCASIVSAQGAVVPDELSISSSYRVVSVATHPVTARNLPWPTVQPAGYAAAPGVVAGTRSWVYTPPLRVTGGSQPGAWMNVYGMTQGVHCGAAVTTFPAPNHYAFECGIGPAVTTAVPSQKIHASTGADILNVARAPLAITTGGITEHVFNLTTPIQLPPASDLLFFLVYRGGEWQDDANGGQTHGVDYQGAFYTPGGAPFWGFASPTQPRTISYAGSYAYRPKIGLLINEPVLCLTGDHGNGYYIPRLVNELFRGISAAYPNYATGTTSTMFFDINAGTTYGAGGQAIVLLNVGANFPGSFPFPPAGNLLLNPADPAFALLAGIVVGLGANGEFSGAPTPFPIPTLGSSAIGTTITGQALVFNPGITRQRLSTKAGMVVNQ